MKLTDRDIEMFRAFSKSDLGKSLVDYCTRAVNYACDVRNMRKEDTRESVEKAADIIENLIISKITKVNNLKDNGNNTTFI